MPRWSGRSECARGFLSVHDQKREHYHGAVLPGNDYVRRLADSTFHLRQEAAMKITVVTGKGGKIIGTALHAPSGDPAIGQGSPVAGQGSPVAGQGGPVAGPGQSVHVIDLPR